MLDIGTRFGRSRRAFLQVGGLALGGLTFADLLRAPAAGAQHNSLLTGKSVVFVFMHGGPPQTETFDPKMTAPPGICSVNGEIATTIPGVTYGAALPRLAALAHRTTIVRSFQTGDGNHDIKPLVGRETKGANLGSLYSRVAGANDPRTGMPTNIALYPQSVDDACMPAIKDFGDFEAAGTLGAAFAPFAPSGGGELRRALKLDLPLDRIDDRRQLLTGLDRIHRSLEADSLLQSVDSLRQRTFDTILGGVADAFDISKEDPRTIARYDTAPLVPVSSIDKRWANHPRYADNVKSLGKLMLLARRLCERGAGFVTVTTNFVWDFHADVNNAGVEEGMRYMGLPFDHAVSAFIEDVHERGLSDDILLVCCGEFGRTPRINGAGGRDHWGGLAPLLVAGGGLKMGQVIGQSNRTAAEPQTEPIRNAGLIATVLNTVLDIGQVRLVRGLPADIVTAATAADPIPGLA